LDNHEQYLGLVDLESFKESFIAANKGKPLFLIRFEKITGMDLLDFVQLLRSEVCRILELDELEFGFHYVDHLKCLLLGITSSADGGIPNIDNAIGRFHEGCQKQQTCNFSFGIARTQCNFISSRDEIYDELYRLSEKNLKDNLVRWSWTYFNRANNYFSGAADDAVIQPTVFYDDRNRTFSVKGGEVFVGGRIYADYASLINDIPADQDLNRIELLILEKLIIACARTPGVLKFNISPQSLIDTFGRHERVTRFNRLLHENGLNPVHVRLELVEKPYYEELGRGLKDVCQDFYNYGVTFAADDFGVKSQSHQVVLELGVMIKEFKLDPISFKFKADEDRIKFLDNLAFIAYCKRLADNREAAITAEAVEEFDTLQFLLEHRIQQYQANIFFKKMPVVEYRETFGQLKSLPDKYVFDILKDPDLYKRQQEVGNIFKVAREIGYRDDNFHSQETLERF